MNIRRIHIKNLRSCKDVKIQFGSMHSLVGANNAGKSSILRALDFFFNQTDLATEITDLPKLTAEARRTLGLSDESGKPLIARHVARFITAKTPPEIPASLLAIIGKAVNVSWTKSCLAGC